MTTNASDSFLGCKQHAQSDVWTGSPFADWQTLPVEVFNQMLEYLGPKEHVALWRTCVRFHRQIEKFPRAQMILHFHLLKEEREAARHAKLAAQGKAPNGMPMEAVVTEICEDKLYLSGDQWKVQELDRLHITGVLTIQRQSKVMMGWKGAHKVVALDDWEMEPIQEHFDACLAFIDAHERCLVHCGAGASRSPTIVIAWLISRRQMTLRDAYDKCKGLRPWVLPNEGFMEQLIILEKSLLGKNTVSLDDFDFGDD